MSEATAPIVGRTEELQQIDAGIEAAIAGSGKLFAITGEPGIGKTRLADEMTSRAREKGFTVHWGRCWEVGGAPAFWPWIQIFRSLSRDADTNAAATAYGDVLSRLLPELRDGEVSRAIEQAQARFRLFDELWALLRAVSEHKPLMLVLDDLHAADPSSVSLLRLVARDLRQTRTLVVGTFRDREAKPEATVAEALRAIRREGISLGLRRLGVDDVAALLSARAGSEVTQALATRVQAATDGNPLFVDEVCRLLGAGQGFHGVPGELPIPSEMRDAIRERLASLDQSGRTVLEAGAVLGRDFTDRLVAAVLGVAHPDVAEPIQRCIDAGLVQEIGLGRFEICHALFREAVYRDLPRERRAALHAHAAEVLEETTAAERAMGEVAQHLLLAVSVVGVTRVHAGCFRAAQRAMSALAFEDASSILSTELAEIGPSLDERSRAEALVLLGESRARGGEPDLARKACEEAADIARANGDPELLARSALGFGAEIVPALFSAPLIALLNEARGELPETSSELRARVLARLAAALQPAADPKVPMAMAREAVAMARAMGKDDTLRAVLYHAGSALADIADPEERLGWDAEYLALAERYDDVSGSFRARVRLFFDHLERGETGAADRQLDLHGESADRLGLPDHQWRTLMMRALRAVWEGRFEDAETHNGQARRIANRTRIMEAQVVEPLHRIGALLARGEDLVGLDEVFARTQGFHGAREMELAVDAYLASEKGDLGTAARLVSELPAQSYIWEFADTGTRMLVEVAARTGDVKLAERLRRAIVPHAKRMVSWGRIAMITEGPATWLLGSLATTLGRFDEAEEWLEDALSRCRATSMRPYEAIAYAEYARLLRVRGDSEAKRIELAERGISVARAIGAEGTARRIARNAGIQKGAEPPSMVRTEEPAAVVALVREGEFWELRCRGRALPLKDSRGVRLLAELVAHSGREFHVLTLVGSEGADVGDAGDIIDHRAQRAYRERLEDLRDQIREAESFGDTGRASGLNSELDRLGEELASAVGLGGRSRKAGAAAERARVNVQKRLRDAIRRIAQLDAFVGRHLERSVRTGTFCAYEPE